MRTDSDSEVLLNVLADEVHRAHQRCLQVSRKYWASAGWEVNTRCTGPSSRSSRRQLENGLIMHKTLCYSQPADERIAIRNALGQAGAFTVHVQGRGLMAAAVGGHS